MRIGVPREIKVHQYRVDSFLRECANSSSQVTRCSSRAARRAGSVCRTSLAIREITAA